MGNVKEIDGNDRSVEDELEGVRGDVNKTGGSGGVDNVEGKLDVGRERLRIWKIVEKMWNKCDHKVVEKNLGGLGLGIFG